MESAVWCGSEVLNVCPWCNRRHLDRENIYSNSRAIVSLSKGILGYYLQMVHDRIFPNPYYLDVFVHMPSFPDLIKCYVTPEDNLIFLNKLL
jgi:hypothetical protein